MGVRYHAEASAVTVPSGCRVTAIEAAKALLRSVAVRDHQPVGPRHLRDYVSDRLDRRRRDGELARHRERQAWVEQAVAANGKDRQ